MLAGNDKQYLYHNSTLAIDADTGKIVWYLQHNVDHWDLDHPFERILVDTAVAPDASAVAWINPRVRPGTVHKVITGVPGKTGIVYTIDRETGQFLWARPTVEQNVISAVNTESGAGVVNEEKLFTGPNQEMLVCPSLTGGKNYHAGAYSPQTRLIYMPLQNICMTSTSTSARPSLDELYAIRTKDQIAPGTQNVGTIEAISVETGKTVWKREQRAGQTSLMTTASGLLFGGDTAGRFRAYDAQTGAVLWEVNLGSHVTGFPATFAVNGKQYVAVSTGATPNTFGLATLTPESRAGTANNLYVFAFLTGFLTEPSGRASRRPRAHDALRVGGDLGRLRASAVATPGARQRRRSLLIRARAHDLAARPRARTTRSARTARPCARTRCHTELRFAESPETARAAPRPCPCAARAAGRPSRRTAAR
jgi:alcohol dehydrogenase (cytochrome c)